MKLYGYFRSSAAFRVRIALNLKGIRYEQAAIHLRKNEQRRPDYLALQPQGLVPALEIDDGEVLIQSLAIIEYLDETQPEPPLLPGHPAGRARVRGLAQAVACDIHPIDNLRVLRYLSHELRQDEKGVEGRRASSAMATRLAWRMSAWCRRCSTRSAIRASTCSPTRRSAASSPMP